jgi:hypothetical protein
MEGSGWVYQAYVRGRIQGTDEISVLYDPFSHRPLTVPLVNVRFCLHQLVRRGVVAECDAENAMRDLKCIPLEERSRWAVLRRLEYVFGKERLKAAFKGAAGINSNIKRRDALEMLHSIRCWHWGRRLIKPTTHQSLGCLLDIGATRTT